MENTANHINSLVEDQENTQLILNLQNSLIGRYPRLIEPCRKLIREGVLQKVTRKNDTVRRYCTLMSDIFMYSRVCKERQAGQVVENSLECCCIFPLKKCKVQETLRGTFRIKCQDDEIVLQTSDEQLAKEWVQAIKEAIEMHVEYRRTLRKESSRRMPLRKKKDLRNMNSVRPGDEDQQPLSPRTRNSVYENVVKMMSRSDDEEEAGGQYSDSSEDDYLSHLKCFKGRKPKWMGMKMGLGKRKGEEEVIRGSATETGLKAAKRTKISLMVMDQENVAPLDSSTPLEESLQQQHDHHRQETETEMKKRTVRFSNIKPVPFKYDDDQEYLNSKFLERTAPRQTIVKETFTRRMWNFFNGLF